MSGFRGGMNGGMNNLVKQAQKIQEQMQAADVYARSVDAAPVKFARISSLLGGRSEKDCVKVIRRLLKWIGLETSLSAEGVKAEDVEWMTENAFKVSSASIKNHPKVFTKEEVKAIYKEAL